MNIDQNIIDEVIRKNDIVDVIGKHLKLKRSGNNYFACCPFHNEKSASFSINVNRQFFHCFGCGESGNVITFIMKHNGLDFVQAVKFLADLSGIYIPESTVKLSKQQIQERKVHKATLQDTINKVVQYYQNNLVNSSMASSYLHKRGLTQEIIQQFKLGYVADMIAPLSNIFKDYAQNTFLFDAGLVIKNDKGKLFDRFRSRIMFPIHNIRGEVIGFGGRIINSGEPKYLNSPETELFNKSQELYGLFEAQKHIRDRNQAIVVEGYMDVIACAQFGVSNVVATMGTAATEEHVKKLFRLCDNIYYCFDGDKAGYKAALRALERSVSLVSDTKSVYFIFLPQDDDPDSFLRKHGLAAFRQYEKKHSLSMSDFLLKQLTNEVDITNNEGRAKLVSLAKPYLEKITAPALQVMLKQQLADLVGLGPNILESILNNRSRYAFFTHKLNKVMPTTKTRIPVLNNIELIIYNALKNIEWVINYKLPENIEHYSREVQELILLLDFINNNYDEEPIKLIEIQQQIEFISLDLVKIQAKTEFEHITYEDFKLGLDKIFGRSTKWKRVPKIKMRNDDTKC
ncbi:MAG: DNA primase [Burkholderiales bacterium]|nr:DNA primase [Burkholderiales bacterium]